MTTDSQSIYENSKEEILKDFFDFLRFKSIGTDTDYDQETLACAKWVETYLEESGLQVERLVLNEGKPVFLATTPDFNPEHETLLIYNHYDVQPADPLELWDSEPFKPEVRNGEIYARGATDNKGPCMYVLAAVREFLSRNKQAKLNIKLLIEGEEESGSGSLSLLLEKHPEKFKADHILIVDVGVHSLDRPSVTIGTRGIITSEVEFIGSSSDLHSGSFGGLAYNPLHALVEVLGKLRDENGRVQVEGFYDNIRELSEREKSHIDFSFDTNELKKAFDLDCTGGEKDLSPLESAWLRPTLEINGISGGYAGPGFKTVIPAKATAKISCRLCPGQNPREVGENIGKFIEEHTPKGIKANFNLHQGQGEGVVTSPDSKLTKSCQEVISGVTGKSCSIILDGASIPIAPELRAAAGGDIAYIGYMLPDDYLHAPNEHYGVERMALGFRTIYDLLDKLS